ncbi:MAG TPA: hypothetical protein VJ913_03565 [Actinomycetota bacterium]|nr:hypothetical protein [Actinomycetota bacterium]
MPDAFADLERAREAVVAEGAAFAEELEPILAASLRRGFERLCLEQADLVSGFDPGTRAALDPAVGRAVDAGAAAVVDRLRSPEIWLAPLTAPELVVIEHAGWPTWMPESFARILRPRRRDLASLGELDDPGNRVWVAICGASAPVDSVLEEFGFRHARRRIGGGRFDVGPRTLPRLDPSGVLQRRWKRYRSAFDRMSELAAEG